MDDLCGVPELSDKDYSVYYRKGEDLGNKIKAEEQKLKDLEESANAIEAMVEDSKVKGELYG